MYQSRWTLGYLASKRRNSLSADANAARRPLLHFHNINSLQSLTI